MKNYFLMSFLFLFVSCQAPIKEVEIDNPSSNTISVQFDGAEKLSLAPGETKKIELRFGKRTLKVNSESLVEINLDPDHDYLINPLKANYYEEEVHYFSTPSARKRYERDHLSPKSVVEGYEINGAFRKIENKLLIKNTWQLGVGQAFTPEVRLEHQNKEEHHVIKKLHRGAELGKVIRENTIREIQKNLQLTTE